MSVSIHAPTGGATASPVWSTTFNRLFQFTRQRGARLAPPPTAQGTQRFQFTRPRGARRRKPKGKHRRKRFNSRAHGGRDNIWNRSATYKRFQFTRPRGARHYEMLKTGTIKEFQFTRPRGARRPQQEPAGDERSFNSRAHGGRDTCQPIVKRGRKVSIHAPTGGATNYTVTRCSFVVFQFTRPRGGATR